MRKFQRICMIVWLILFAAAGSAVQAQSYAKLWQEMEQARDKSLPKTMIQVADRIIRKAEREQNAPQLLKATVWGEYVQSRLTPDSIYAGIRHLEQWAAVEKDPVNRAILYSLLADRYCAEMWKRDRYGGLLTDLELEEAPEDLREWTVNLFARKVDALCKASLREEEALLQASAKAYQPFVILGEGSRFYAHDMYHLLARRALRNYERLLGTETDSLVMASARNLTRRMAAVYAQRPDAAEAALLTALDWVADERLRDSGSYLHRLDSLIARYGNLEVCAEVYISKAKWQQNLANGSLLDCLSTCDEGLKRYPKYKRIQALKNIREEVKQPLLSGVLPAHLYPGDTLKLDVQHRNLQGFTLNLYRTAYAEIPELDEPIRPAFIQQQGKRVASLQVGLKPSPKEGRAAAEWKYLRSDTVVNLLTPAETGVYIVEMVPASGKAPMEANFLVLSQFRPMVLDLGEEGHEVLVLDAASGHPIAGAEVVGYDRFYPARNEKVLQRLTTNAEGKVLFTQQGVTSYTVRKGKDTALPRQRVGAAVYYGNGQPKEEKHLTLLTDRSIYRPGQTVHVKGVAYRQQGWDAQVLKQAAYELVLLDANRKELAAQQLRTNEFGSFTADFILPSACLNGTFTLHTRDRKAVKTIQVEEYKRPTFEIQFTPIQEAYCLGEKVVLKGNVQAFNGRSVQEVPLAYTLRVSDRHRYSYGPEKAVKADTVLLDAKGHFELAIDLPKGEMPLYYEVEAVVTDEGGETQTATYRFQAAAQRYVISMGFPQVLLKEYSLQNTIHVTNAANVAQAVTGTATLYRKDDWQQLRQKGAAAGVTPVWTGSFRSNQSTDFSGWRELPSGAYCLQLCVRDSLGREQVYPGGDASSAYREPSELSFVLLSKNDRRLPVFTDFFYSGEQEYMDEKQPAVWYLGTSFRDAYVLMDVFCGRKRIESRVLHLSDSLMRMELPYQASYGDGVAVVFTFVKHGKVYSRSVHLRKIQPDRKLDLKWEVFRDRLRPGQEETWKLTVKRPDGLPASAELLAMLYDASLDKLRPHHQGLKVYHDALFDYRTWDYSDAFPLYFRFYFPWTSRSVPEWTYDAFYQPMGVTEVLSIVGNSAAVPDLSLRGNRPMYKAAAGNAVEIKYVPVQVDESGSQLQQVLFEEEVVPVVEEASDAAETARPEIRRNFAETAFFYPQLHTNEQGEIVFSFTIPESLTRWNFRGFAHTQDMQTGQLEAEVVTAKEFMLQPNLPRFLRTGDRTQVTAVLSNLTEKSAKGMVKLFLHDPVTDRLLFTQKKKFTVAGGKNASVKFDFKVSDRCPLVVVRLVAENALFSDGEQQLLPVLSNQVFVTETLPVTVSGKEQKDYSLAGLFNGQQVADGRRLTVEFTGNPAWYAVQALPSLAVPTTENATAYATAFYANTLAAYVAGSQPKIQAMIEQWKKQGGTKAAFLSQLDKNAELKQTLLSETPWVLEAATEAQQRERLATLFDLNQLKDRRYAALVKLGELQYEEGGWSWYKGMPVSRSMTAYITELLVRLPQLTGEQLTEEALRIRTKAFAYLHQEAWDEYRQCLKAEKQGAKFTTPSPAALTYLYLVACSGEEVPEANRKAWTYFLNKVGGLLTTGNVAEKARAAVVLWKADQRTAAREFVASLREHLITEAEVGAHFAFLDTPYRWGMLPIPVHVTAMEAMLLETGNEQVVEDMKRWLLKQKQSTCWNSPVATADAVYALLCSGHNLLADSGEVQITIGQQVLNTLQGSSDLAGLNYVKETFTENSPEVKATQISVDNRSEGMAWGAVYAQYFAPMSEVQSQGGALTVHKQLWVERVDATGHKTLQPLGEGAALKVGDQVVSRLTLKLDRAMDFVQLKDQHGACFEPVVALSGYRWMNRVGCYQEIEDAATHFFFDQLGKGVYVLENRFRVARAGTYAAGIATAQSAYAPEFAAHSAGVTVVCE